MVLFQLFLFLGLFTGAALAEDLPPELSAEDAAFPLGAVLAPILDDKALEGATYGVQVVNVHTGEEVFARRADQNMVPASVMKVVTAAVALKTLGPGHKFSTLVTTDGEVGEDGTLKGNLYVRGFGDPTLVGEKLHRLVADLPLMGVKHVEGDLVFDDSYFDDDRLIAGWRKRIDLAQGPAYFAPISALDVNFNAVSIVVAPAKTAGGPARAVFETPIPMISLTNEVTTGSTRSRTRIEVVRTVSGDTVHFKLTGSISQAAEPKRIYRAIDQPRPFFEQMFAVAMKERGVSVSGSYRHGRAPKGARIVARMDSDAVGVIVGRMNKHSSNFMAEHLLKAVAAETAGAPGTFANGTLALEKYLVSLGNKPDGFTVVNGSGLSREISVSASLISGLMIDMYHDRKVGPEFVASMSIGGEDGTLFSRFRSEEHRGRVRGKTGSLNGIHALTCYIDGGDGTLYVVTFLANGISGSTRKVRNVHDRFVQEILQLSSTEAGKGG